MKHSTQLVTLSAQRLAYGSMPLELAETTMGDKSVETLCHFRLLKANLFPNLYNTTPFPLLNVGFPVSRICLFPVQH